VAARRFRDSCRTHGAMNHTLDDRLVEMMSPTLPGPAIRMEPRRREDPLPRPFAAGIGILSRQRVRKLDPPRTHCYVPRVEPAHALDMPVQRAARGDGEERHAIFVAFATPYDDLTRGKLDVLPAQTRARDSAESSDSSRDRDLSRNDAGLIRAREFGNR
jgi:hypothetical protein